ncbi:hypothetical protein SAMN05444397_11831 [Flavobacterium aquidurense]|uniref:Arylsulfatase n=1 Tax=Flavobacterium frigidimaris TaxID=262320 RepID=A0ABX4BLD9_FLAFR|nr:hypothetical protein [Flavobacterium frigidimaris]OXA76555.1 hypothetical protein B0A65_18770 [Flavobacterium frigidimaris]SDZ66974.1 hypothetical protein SAMN05444397_11831 [Flavobacterium aquidurense]
MELKETFKIFSRIMALVIIFFASAILSPKAEAQTGKKPNILIIFGDDIGQSYLLYLPAHNTILNF